jgi:hypothetical protein
MEGVVLLYASTGRLEGWGSLAVGGPMELVIWRSVLSLETAPMWVSPTHFYIGLYPFFYPSLYYPLNLYFSPSLYPSSYPCLLPSLYPMLCPFLYSPSIPPSISPSISPSILALSLA